MSPSTRAGVLMPADPQWSPSGGGVTPLGRQQASRLVLTSTTATAGSSLLPSPSTLAVRVTRLFCRCDGRQRRNGRAADGHQATVTSLLAVLGPPSAVVALQGGVAVGGVSTRAPLVLTPTIRLAAGPAKLCPWWNIEAETRSKEPVLSCGASRDTVGQHVFCWSALHRKGSRTGRSRDSFVGHF